MFLKNFLQKHKSTLLFLLALFAFRSSFLDQYRIPSGSMEPGLLVGDIIGVNKMAYDLKIPFTQISLKAIKDPQPGDIIVFIWPGDNKSNFVKRLIAGPGDTISIKDGFISLNNQPLNSQNIYQDFLDSNQPLFSYQETLNNQSFTVKRNTLSYNKEDLQFTLKQDQYFFMGDNRDNSADSRAWGVVRRDQIKGQVKIVLINTSGKHFKDRVWFDLNKTP